MTTEPKVPADEVWKLVGGFDALLDRHPPVLESRTDGEGGGSVRRLSLAGGDTIVERLESVDDDQRHDSDSIIDRPFPLSDDEARIRVRDKSDSTATKLEWSSEFGPRGAPENAASKAIQGIHDAGVVSLKKIFGG